MAWAWLGLHCVAQKQGRSSESGTQFRTGTRSRRAPVLTSLHLSGWPINARSHPEVDLPGKLFLFFLDPVDASMLSVCVCVEWAKGTVPDEPHWDPPGGILHLVVQLSLKSIPCRLLFASQQWTVNQSGRGKRVPFLRSRSTESGPKAWMLQIFGNYRNCPSYRCSITSEKPSEQEEPTRKVLYPVVILVAMALHNQRESERERESCPPPLPPSSPSYIIPVDSPPLSTISSLFNHNPFGPLTTPSNTPDFLTITSFRAI